MKMNAKKTIIALTKWIPDKLYLKLMYRRVTGKKLNLNNPITFNEKLQWLKLYYHDPLHTKMVDKYEVRTYIADKIGKNYLIPLLGVWDTVEEVDFEALPERFVLKCTHDSAGIVICKNKSALDIESAKKELKAALKRQFFYQGREWPYKNVKPRIIAEQYMEDTDDDQLTDYKVFNFNGCPKIIQVDYDRYQGHKRQFFDTDWNKMDISFHFPSDNSRTLEKPAVLDELLHLATILSAGFPHLRTDFYIINGQIYVGEMTFFHGTGMGKWTPEGVDAQLGSWIDLSKVSGGKNK